MTSTEAQFAADHSPLGGDGKPSQHEFLSEGWLLAARRVQHAVGRSLGDLGLDVRLNVAVHDCPPSVRCDHLQLRVAADVVDFVPEWSDEADATVLVDYPTARRVLTSGSMDVALHEMLNGTIVVEGDFLAVIRFGGMMATEGTLVAAEIGRRLTEITVLDDSAS